MKRIIFFMSLVSFCVLCLCTSCCKEEIYVFTPNDFTIGTNGHSVNFLGCEDGVVTYKVENVWEKSSNTVCQILIDDKELATLTDDQLPYVGKSEVMTEGKHVFTLKYGIKASSSNISISVGGQTSKDFDVKIVEK